MDGWDDPKIGPRGAARGEERGSARRGSALGAPMELATPEKGQRPKPLAKSREETPKEGSSSALTEA
jgi:hypothetical protein